MSLLPYEPEQSLIVVLPFVFCVSSFLPSSYGNKRLTLLVAEVVADMPVDTKLNLVAGLERLAELGVVIDFVDVGHR